ncbi:hypothetical protein P8610_01750 [Fictibacillus sp. UD]
MAYQQEAYRTPLEGKHLWNEDQPLTRATMLLPKRPILKMAAFKFCLLWIVDWSARCETPRKLNFKFSSCDVSLPEPSLSCGTGGQVRHLYVKRTNVAHRLPRGKRASGAEINHSMTPKSSQKKKKTTCHLNRLFVIYWTGVTLVGCHPFSGIHCSITSYLVPSALD